ncbi:unnamed protein product, partial [marine sediment metagenome]
MKIFSGSLQLYVQSQTLYAFEAKNFSATSDLHLSRIA